MKMFLPVALAGLAISFALPTFAQQTNTSDPRTMQQIRALTTKYEEAYNSHDAAAVAALYTGDGALVTTRNGVKHGRPSQTIAQKSSSSIGMPIILSKRSIG
jgi:hypothetical protein